MGRRTCVFALVKLLMLLYSSEAYNFKCPADGRHHLLPHETNCAMFYYCEYGVRRNDARCCPPKTLFAYDKQVCDHARLVKCVTGGQNDVGVGCNQGCNNKPGCDSTCNGNNGGDTGGGDTGGGDTGGSGDGCNNGTLPNGCPANWSIHHLMPHESDCTKFYQCVHGKKVLMPCGPGTHFNAKLQICDHPANAGCDPTCGGGDTGGGDTGGGDTGGGDTGCNNGTLPNGCPADFCISKLLPHETDCGKYYCCVNGEKVLSNCGAGLHFNAKLEKCQDPATAGCAPVCEVNKCKDCHVRFWRHETDCGQFWRCENGQEVLSACPEGLVFNEVKQTCDFKCNVPCTRLRPNALLENGKATKKTTSNNILNRIINLIQ